MFFIKFMVKPCGQRGMVRIMLTALNLNTNIMLGIILFQIMWHTFKLILAIAPYFLKGWTNTTRFFVKERHWTRPKPTTPRLRDLWELGGTGGQRRRLGCECLGLHQSTRAWVFGWKMLEVGRIRMGKILQVDSELFRKRCEKLVSFCWGWLCRDLFFFTFPRLYHWSLMD